MNDSLTNTTVNVFGALPPGLSASLHDVAWQALINDAGCLVSVLDRDGRWLFANEATGRFVGRSALDLIGLTISEVFPEDFADERMSIIRRVITAGETVSLVTRLMGGRMDCVYRLLHDEQSNTPYVLSVGRSVTLGDAAMTAPAPSHQVIEISTPESVKLDSLTPREREVLKMIGEGLSTQQIAGRLFRTVKTVEAHRASLGRKLGVSNRVQLAHIAIQAGLVSHPHAESPLATKLKKALVPGPDEQF